MEIIHDPPAEEEALDHFLVIVLVMDSVKEDHKFDSMSLSLVSTAGT